MNNDKIGNIKDEFIHKYNLPYLQYKRLVELCDLVELKARSDTAKQIFKEIDELFLTDNPRTQLTPITYKAYQATKKKYGVKK
jgi:hypothetical protein